MKLLVILLIGFVVVSAVSAGQSSMVIPSDDEIKRMLKNERLRVPIVKCLVGTGKCIGVGKQVKDLLEMTMKEDCKSCTPEVKARAPKMISYIRSAYPRDWAKLIAKYDPQGVYERRFKAQLEKQ